MFQIVFNQISAAEISQLPTLEQLEILSEFKVSPQDLENLDAKQSTRFGKIEREGQRLFRYRAGEVRIYFSVEEGNVVVHRVFNANTFADFLYRCELPVKSEDQALAELGKFWELIDEGKKAQPA